MLFIDMDGNTKIIIQEVKMVAFEEKGKKEGKRNYCSPTKLQKWLILMCIITLRKIKTRNKEI